jgi:hypothetical protein
MTKPFRELSLRSTCNVVVKVALLGEGSGKKSASIPTKHVKEIQGRDAMRFLIQGVFAGASLFPISHSHAETAVLNAIDCIHLNISNGSLTPMNLPILSESFWGPEYDFVYPNIGGKIVPYSPSRIYFDLRKGTVFFGSFNSFTGEESRTGPLPISAAVRKCIDTILLGSPQLKARR